MLGLSNRVRILIIAVLTLTTSCMHALSSLAKNDAYPVYTTLDPHLFLTLQRRLYLINHTLPDIPGIENDLSPLEHHGYYKDSASYESSSTQDSHLHIIDHNNTCLQEWVNFSVSPFGQNANSGANVEGMYLLPAQACEDPPCGASAINLGEHGTRVQLGDLTGRINMLALLYGAVPAGQTLAPTLQTAQDQVFMTYPPEDEESIIDPTERYASLTFPLKYSKRGVRFDFSGRLACGFGANVQTGVASITQKVRRVRLKRADATNNLNIENDLTCIAESLCDFVRPSDAFTDDVVEPLLMRKFDNITEELGVDTTDFSATSIEEIRFNLFWRHIFDINHVLPAGPHFLCMPFLVASGSVSPGKVTHPSKLFSAEFGNNGHSAVGGTAGIEFDFVNTIDLAAEIGYTHFFPRCVECLRVPNNKYQKTLFPFTANARVQPGYNWHFAAKMGAFHFLGKLSFYFQFVMLEHKEDKICLQMPDAAFKPQVLERVTGFKSKMANIGFNYDLSPNISLGFLWQAPLSQQNSYRSTTAMFSVSGTF